MNSLFPWWVVRLVRIPKSSDHEAFCQGLAHQLRGEHLIGAVVWGHSFQQQKFEAIPGLRQGRVKSVLGQGEGENRLEEGVRLNQGLLFIASFRSRSGWN